MQTVIRCLTIQEAYRVRLFLDSVGIESFIPDETTNMMLPNQFFHAPGIRVEVNEADFAEAQEALKEFHSENTHVIASNQESGAQ